MLVSMNWIKEYVDLEGENLRDLIMKFTLSTAEVEDIFIKGEEVKDVVVGEIVSFEADEDFTMTIHDSGTAMEGFYDRSYLEKTDQYSSFISGNHAYVTIEKNGGEDRPRMLLVKDSFGHSLAPFLAYHFDLEIIDLRYYKLSLMDLIREAGVSKVLAMYNMDSVTNSNSLQMLNLSLK